MTALKSINPAEDGVVSYNGFVFGPFRSVTSQVGSIYDEAGRVVIASEITLTVHAIIHGETVAAHAANMDEVLSMLAANGGRLVVRRIGLGSDIDSSINPDLNFGPKPQVVSCRPVGNELAWEIVWTVVYRRAPLFVAKSQAGAITAANWDIEFSIDENGLVTRSVSGYIEILVVPKSAGGNATVDAGKIENVFLGALKIEKIPWMRRVSARRRINHAKNRIDFAVVDTELEDSAYPQGITHAEAELTIENNPPGFVNWTAALSASFTVAPGLPKSIAATRWFLMLFDAAAKAREAVKSAKGVVIPERFRITVPKFGRTCRFAASWRMTACLHDILAKSGLWEPVAGTDYNLWSQSMDAAGVNNLNGVSTLGLYGDDFIINLGSSHKTMDVKTKGLKPDRIAAIDQKLLCPEVTEEQSYLGWENRIRAAQEQNAVIHRPMQKVAPILGAIAGGGTPSAIAAGVISYFLQPETGLKQDVIQRTGKTDNMVVMSGKSMRLKFAAEVPRLKKVAGADVFQLAERVESRAFTGIFDCPVIVTRWTILYRVPDQIYGVKPPSNRHICFTEGEDDGHGGQAAAKK